MKTIKLMLAATGSLWLTFMVAITIAGLIQSGPVSLVLMMLVPYVMIATAIGLLTLLTTFFGHIWRGPQKSGYFIYAIYGAIGPGVAFFWFDLPDSYFTPEGISIKFVGTGIIIGALNGLASRYLLARFCVN